MRRPRPDFYQLWTDRKFSDFSVISRLSSKPISVGQPEKAAEPQIRISSDAALSRDNISHTLGGNIDFLCQAILANTHGFEKLLQKEFTGGNRFKFTHMSLLSVVVHYFYIFSTRVGPAKTDAPLIIDTNAVLPLSVANQGFKAVARR